MSSTSTVAGIDIGGERKGCHLVILRGTTVLCVTKSKEAKDMFERCLAFDAVAVGVDAPCRWGSEGAGRHAERELTRQGIFCFATPTRKLALSSTSGFYDWIFSGERVYQTFASTYPLFMGGNYSKGRVCFETFPHAITCAMLGNEVASAKRKRPQRREILESAGVDAAGLKSIDAVDAALCALTARYLLEGKTVAHGDVAGGHIVVPVPPPNAQRNSSA
jgi:predicted nuclease with RNAse H fold